MTKCADHTNWRGLFQQATGYEAQGDQDRAAFGSLPPSVTSTSVICASATSTGEAALPRAMRRYLGPPPKLVLKFRRLLNWCDKVFTHWCLRLSRS